MHVTGLHMARGIALLLALLALTGCYSSLDPVIETGDAIDIAGKYRCVETGNGRVFTLDFRENKQGNFFPAYSYAANGKIYKFLKIDTATYIGQEGDERNKLLHLFFVQMSGRTAMVRVPDLAAHAPAIEDAMQASHVNVAGRTGHDTILIEGTPAEKIAFLKRLSPSLLREAATCAPR